MITFALAIALSQVKTVLKLTVSLANQPDLDSLVLLAIYWLCAWLKFL